MTIFRYPLGCLVNFAQADFNQHGTRAPSLFRKPSLEVPKPCLFGMPREPNGGLHQVDRECCGGYRGRVMAVERLWADAVSHQHSHRQAVTEQLMCPNFCQTPWQFVCHCSGDEMIRDGLPFAIAAGER